MFGDILPDDCVVVILSFLREWDLLRIASVSKKWEVSKVSRSDRLWESKFENLKKKAEEENIDKEILERVKMKEKTVFFRYKLFRDEFNDIPPPVRMTNEKYSTPLVRVVLVGNDKVGKTCSLISYTCGAFPDEYVPKVFDQYSATILYENRHITDCISIELIDTNNELPLEPQIEGANVFIVLFSISDQETLHSAYDWRKKLWEMFPRVPIILAGNKLHLRDDSGTMRCCETTSTTQQQGETAMKRMGAKFYCEYSARSQKGLKEVFQYAVDLALRPEKYLVEKKKKKKKRAKDGCTMM